MLDNLDELRTFQRILALGSLSATARELGVGAAVISKRLATLERRTGVRLINRTTRSLSPTEEGAQLLLHIDRMLEELAAAETRLTRGREEPEGLLRISAPVSFGRHNVAPVALALSGRHPRLRIDLMLTDRLVDLIEERIDVAVRIGPPQDSSAIMRKLADNRRILVAAPAYLDRTGRPAAPHDLARHACLRYGDGNAPWQLEGLDGESVEIAPPSRLHCDNGDAIHDWAVAGAGIMLKSAIDVAADLATGRLERVLPDWASTPAPIYALYPSGRHASAKLRAFLAAMAAYLGRHASYAPGAPG